MEKRELFVIFTGIILLLVFFSFSFYSNQQNAKPAEQEPNHASSNAPVVLLYDPVYAYANRENVIGISLLNPYSQTMTFTLSLSCSNEVFSIAKEAFSVKQVKLESNGLAEFNAIMAPVDYQGTLTCTIYVTNDDTYGDFSKTFILMLQ